MLSSSNPEKLTTKNSGLFTPRWGHTAILYNDVAIIYGGFSRQNNHENYFNDIVKLDLDSLSFSSMPATGDLPRRSNHTAVLYNDEMIIHGGKDGVSFYNETYSYNLLTNDFIKLETTSDDIVQDRAYHTANIYKDYMIVFGGEINSQILDDLWVLDLPTKKWYNIPLPNGMKLEPRSFHCSEILGDKIYLVGGYCLEMKCVLPITIVDLKNFSLDNPAVTVHRIKTHLPIPRWGGVMKEYNSSLYLYGGRNGYDSNEFVILTDNKWKEIRFKNNIIPPCRRANGLIYNGCFIILGGLCKDAFSNDVYAINLNTLAESVSLPTEISGYINNKEFSDITIINGKRTYYAHLTLFFSRISCIDIPKNKDICDLRNKKITSIDLTSYGIGNHVVMNLLELLYTGKFTGVKFEFELFEIYTLLTNMHLSNTRDKVKQFALYNYPKQYPTDSTDMKKFQTNDVLLNPKQGDVILRLNQTLDIAAFYYKYNHYHIIDMMMFRNKPLYLHREYIDDLLSFVPKTVLDAIIFYTINNDLKGITSNDIITAIELLFFADYFCFYSLIQV
jgi:N-acetylneuraminic acid mutarotase